MFAHRLVGKITKRLLPRALAGAIQDDARTGAGMLPVVQDDFPLTMTYSMPRGVLMRLLEGGVVDDGGRR